MRVALLLLALLVVVPTASAQPSQQIAVTTKAYNESVAAERRVAQLAGQRATLIGRYDDELRKIDSLKKQRASWRRDRDLRDQLAASLETAKQLKAKTDELERAKTQLVSAHGRLVGAIDAELAQAPTPQRKTQLERARIAVAPQRKAPRRIVLPDTKIDPLADPEELDQQAAVLRETESELARQVAGLEAQAKELDRVAALRKQHERANEVALRDDDTPRRGTPASNGRTLGGAAEDDSQSPSPPSGGGGAGGDSASPAGGPANPFESEATVVLADVVDPSTIDSLHRAQRSGDPAQRAQAAKKARDAVNTRLEQLRLKRLQIEARAKQLRK